MNQGLINLLDQFNEYLNARNETLLQRRLEGWGLDDPTVPKDLEFSFEEFYKWLKERGRSTKI